MSCNSGFRSLPSCGGMGRMRSKGFDVMRINSRKPTATNPSMDSTRACISSGKDLLKMATAKVHPASISIQSNKEPSWPPQIALTLKYTGKSELELEATYLTEKSSCKNEYRRQQNEKATNIKKPVARERPERINKVLPR